MLTTSNYNYFLPYKDNKTIVFNGLTKRFFLISRTNAEAMEETIRHPDEYVSIDEYSDLLSKLQKGGFIHNNDINEIEIIKDGYQKYIDNNDYTLIILTTYNCNFHCWYCTQKHVDESLSDDIVKRIKKHISKYLTDNNINQFNLSWFGGEPSLQADKIIEISSFAKDFCLKHCIEFNNGITTNGSLLTEKMIRNFALCQLTDFQITIDGTKDMHNKVRFNNDIKDSFSIICNNLIRIIDNIPKAKITLRFNYTAKNLTSKIIDDLNDALPEDYRRKIIFFPRKVWQESENNINDKNLESLQQKAIDSGYILNYSNDIINNICYAEKKHFNTIFQNGEVDKCSNLEGASNRGVLDDTGNIIWNNDLPEYHQEKFPYSTNCTNCRHLPICMGICPVRRRIAAPNMTSAKCVFDNPDKEFNLSIRNYVSHIVNSMNRK